MIYGDSRLPLRFWAKVHLAESGCWEWTGATVQPCYGYAWNGTANVVAHRWSYEALVGPIPAGLQIDHLCRNKRCVNPAHLEPVTARENGRRADSAAARNARKTTCPSGHPYDAFNCRGHRVCTVCVGERNARRRAACGLEVASLLPGRAA